MLRQAVDARIDNLEILIKQGYRNLVLFNLPDLALTPRYQAKSTAEQENASLCSAHFNAQLAAKAQIIAEKYKEVSPAVHVFIFDIGELFKQVYNNPQEYGFDPAKLKRAYTASAEFKEMKKIPWIR